MMAKVTPKRKRNTSVKELRSRMKEAKVKIGIPKEGTVDYPDGTKLLDVAVANEFGTERIPSRSFVRSSFIENREKYSQMMEKLAKQVIKEQISIEQALLVLGAEGAADIKAKMVELKEPPNDPKTIKRKGSSNPLIDTGHLRNSVTFEVVKDVSE